MTSTDENIKILTLLFFCHYCEGWEHPGARHRRHNRAIQRGSRFALLPTGEGTRINHCPGWDERSEAPEGWIRCLYGQRLPSHRSPVRVSVRPQLSEQLRLGYTHPPISRESLGNACESLLLQKPDPLSEFYPAT